MIYLDTSVLIAYYCAEPLSRQAERLVRSAIGPAISNLTEVELVSALARKVQARALRGMDASTIAAEFRGHVDANLYRRIELERPHFQQAVAWLSRFTTPLRTLDALHLAVAASHDFDLATFDRGLARAARILGVRTIR